MPTKLRHSPNAEERAVFARVRALCKSLPETIETNSWGHPNFRAGKRTFLTFEQSESGPTIAFHLNPADIETYEKAPGFLLTPYGRGAWVSMIISSRVKWALVKDLVLKSYATVALKRMSDALKQQSSAGRERNVV